MKHYFDFSEALRRLKAGKLVSRMNWNGPGQWIAMQSPEGNSKMSLSYLFIRTVCDNLVPWIASQTDLLSNDWFEVEG